LTQNIKHKKVKMWRRDAGNYVESTALLLDSIIRNSVCTPAKLPCRRVEVGYEKINVTFNTFHLLNVKRNYY
jgi:hypothetical protein